MAAVAFRKHFIPLESNPCVFTRLAHDLGVSESLAFQDVFSLDPDLRPPHALALILVFPTSEKYEVQKAKEEAVFDEYTGRGEKEPVVWFKQTINNACGLYGLLHAICNGSAREFIRQGSLLDKLLTVCTPLPPSDRALVLEDSQDLETIYAKAALQGDSKPPTDPEEEIDFHYVCFAISHQNGHLYELDGDRKGPIDRGITLAPGEDVLSEAALSIVREFIQREEGNCNFNLMALAIH